MDKLENIIIELIKSYQATGFDLESFKRKMAKKYKVPSPSHSQLLKIYHELIKKRRARPNPDIAKLLQLRPVRSLSGIVNVSVLTKPYACPGKCIFCPFEKGIPKSYVSGEPAVERAKMLNYDPYSQVKTRLQSLEAIGHPIDKIELRIIGGTWSYYPRQYQTSFIKQCICAANEYKHRGGRTPAQHRGGRTPSALRKLQKKNEAAKCRIVGITIETRPDFVVLAEIKRLRQLGVTRVELGVQTIYNDVLAKNQRGHNIDETIKATQLLKNAGFKVSYQIMPNLFGSSPEKDLAIFKELFSNPDFKPDLLKIYPLALLKNTGLYKLYKQGKFKPYTKKQLASLIIKTKQLIPYWCRIQRIIRDIPSENIIKSGAKVSNLREIIQQQMKKKNIRCKCIRCREVKDNCNLKEKLHIFREDYQASNGLEIFLSFENKARTKLYALLRLRSPELTGVTPPSILGMLKNAAIIREVHTYGPAQPINKACGGKASASFVQHKGLGKKLIKQAEKIAKKLGFQKIAVISSIGTREYYRKLGYRLKDTYMTKQIV